MIKLFFASIVFGVFMSPAQALNNPTDPTLKTRTIKLNKKFNKIILNGDADVVFVKSSNNEITIEERAVIENVVKITNEYGELTIESRDFYRGKKPLILIPVSQLQYLELNGDVSVATTSLFESKEIRVFVNGDCHIQIISSGKVFFDSSPDIYLNYKKKQSRFLPALKN